MTPLLPEGVYPIEDPPTKHQANNKGEVLYYAKHFGWYPGYFNNPYMPGTTHWMCLPDTPTCEPSHVGREYKCKQWLAEFPDLSELAESLLRMGFRAGWDQRL